MTQRDATGSQSATTLGNNSNVRANTNSPIFQSFKRGRHQLEPEVNNEIPAIHLNDENLDSASTETVIANYRANDSETNEVSAVPHTGSNHGRYLVSKLDRLHDKKERYSSHRQFLQKCLDNDIIPNGLRLDLEPTIGNHDEEFLHNWYSKLEEYSKNFMRDVLAFCEKTNDETNASIGAINTELQTAIEKEQYDNVQATVIQNNTIRGNELKRRKNKKFYALKYKKESPRQNPNNWRGNDQQQNNNGWRENNSRDYEDRRDDRRQQITPQNNNLGKENNSREYEYRRDDRRQQTTPQDNNAWRDNNSREYDNRRDDRRQQTTPSNRMTTIGRSYAAVTAPPQQPQEVPRRVRSRQNISRRGSFNIPEDKNAPLHQQISLQRKRSFRRDDNEQRLQSEVTKLQSQLDDIRKKNMADIPGTSGIISLNNNPRLDQIPKNVNNTQSSDMGMNKEIIQEAFSFVTGAMETLRNFETKFATLLSTHATPPDRS